MYYQSQEEVSQGCKGSLKISACEISGWSGISSEVPGIFLVPEVVLVNHLNFLNAVFIFSESD